MRTRIAVLILALLICYTTINAQVISAKVGMFLPSLNSDLWEINLENLAFDKEDMAGLSFSLEYEYFIRGNFSLFFETSHFSKSVFSFYSDFTFDDGSAIEQNLSLRVSSLDIGFKFYFASFKSRIRPFIGAGAGIHSWQYEQWGDFIDFTDNSVSEGYADTDTHSFGLNARAGLVIKPRRGIGLIFEAKYLYLKGELSSWFEGFGDFDLSGIFINAGISFYIW